MINPIPINLVVEDSLSEAVVRKILLESGCSYSVGICYGQGGSGYLKKKICGFNNAAKGTPFFVLTDLDKSECPPALLEEWLPKPRHPNLLFRIAVREVESWLLADQKAISKFLGIQRESVPINVDAEDNPKQLLINLTRKSKNRLLREAIVPSLCSTANVGPDYNSYLISFVRDHWNIKEAMRRSSSLQHTVNAVRCFKPNVMDDIVPFDMVKERR